MIFDALVVGYVRSNALRALVSILAIAFGVAAALALSLASTFAVATLGSDRALFTHHVDFQIAPYESGVPQRVLGDVRYLDGVDSALPIIERSVGLGVDARGDGGLDARLIGTDILQPLPAVTGFEEGLPGPYAPVGTFIDPAAVIDTNGAIVTAQTARRLHLRRGASFRILADARVVTMRVANVLPADVNGIDSSTFFVDVTTAQKLFALAGAFDRIDIVAGGAPQALRPQLLTALAGRARLVDPQTDAASLANLTAGVSVTFGALAAIALAIGGLLVFNAVGTSIVQRRNDIGTLRALGAAPHQIVAAFAFEGACYGAIGATFGIGLGIEAARALARVTHANAGLTSDPWPLVGVWAIGVAIAAISAIVPALAATNAAPALLARQGAFERVRGVGRAAAFAVADTLCLGASVFLAWHPQPGAVFALGMPLGFAAGGALLIPGLLRSIASAARTLGAGAPPAVRLASLAFAATPQRIGIALAALAVAVFAEVAFQIDSRSFETALSTWANRTIAGDLIVKPAGTAGASGATFDRGAMIRTQATPGVRAVAAIRTVHVRSGNVDVALRGDDDFAKLHPVPRVEMTAAPQPASVPAELSSQLASTLHVRPGDTLSIAGMRHNVRLHVVDVQPDFSDGRGAIVVARSVLARTFGDDRIDALRVTLDAGRDPAIVRDAVARRLSALRPEISTARELRERLETVFGTTFSFARALGDIVVAIAVLGIVSALAALVFERRFELRMLRRLGASRGTIARMLLLEAFTIAVSAALLGLLLGLALAAAVLDGSDPATLGFALPMVVPYAAIAVTLAASVGAATLGTAFSLPAAARIATDAARTEPA